ncbi:MAG: helix-turn-helix domain-containing protein [Acidobacteria bacterium]|nr:helix-turn-helix domain-containing protein [Acidobacteriota bacterium]
MKKPGHPQAGAGAKNDRLPSLEVLRKFYGPAPRPAAKPARADLQKLYVREGKSIREVAALLGCTRDMVHRALREYGIEARPVARRSRLQEIPLEKLEAEIAAQGLRGAARAFGVDHSTLAQHVRGRRS